MDYDRIIAINNDSAVYRHGDKSIKVFIQESHFSCALEEGYKTQKVKELTLLNLPQIYSVSLKDNKVEFIAEYIEGETLAQKLKNNPLSEKEVVCKLISLQKEINSYSCVLNREIHFNIEDIENVNIKPVLCHGALNLESVVEHPNGKLYLLNWQDAFEGNKRVDFALTYYELLYSSKQTAEIYFEEYIKATGETKENLLKVMPHVLKYLKEHSNGNKKRFYAQLT